MRAMRGADILQRFVTQWLELYFRGFAKVPATPRSGETIKGCFTVMQT